jgi:hypothetical protein
MVKKVKLKSHSFPLKTLTGYWKFLKSKFSASVIAVVVILVINNSNVVAQSDSLFVVDEGVLDTVHQIKKLDPRKAFLLSAAFPGLGQIYNGKYWKLPFVYGGFAITLSVVYYYQDIYHHYLNELYIFKNTGSFPSGRTETNVRYIIDQSRRNRDYYLIISGVWYLLQIVDAHVDAHLHEFKVNKDLKVSWNPSMQQNVLTGRTTGFSLTFKF